MLPQANAIITSINKPNMVSEDWNTDTSGAGSMIWQGAEDAYVIERMRTEFSGRGGGLDREKDVTVIIPSDLVNGAGEALTLEVGDIVTYTYRTTVFKRRISDFSAPYLPGLNISEYVRLHMDSQTVEATEVTT